MKIEYTLDELIRKLLYQDDKEIFLFPWQINFGKSYLDGQNTKLIVEYKDIKKGKRK